MRISSHNQTLAPRFCVLSFILSSLIYIIQYFHSIHIIQVSACLADLGLIQEPFQYVSTQFKICREN